MKRKWRAGRFALIYTAMFLLCTLCICVFFKLSGKTFIRGIDGPVLHLGTFTHLINWLRAGLSGKGWAMFQPSLGLGMDVFTTWSWFGFTEPLSVLAALLTPVVSAITGFTILLFVRLYLSGLFLGLLAKEYGASSDRASLAAILYSMGCYTSAAIWHFNFGPGMMCLPLVLCAVERALKGRGWRLLTVVAAVQFFANYYFAYKNSWLMVIYVVVRLLRELSKGKSFSACFAEGMKLAGAYLLGLMLAAVLLLPIAAAFLDNARNGKMISGSLFRYDLTQYIDLAAHFFGANMHASWVCVGMIPLCAFAFPKIIRRRKRYADLIILFGVTVVMVSIPAIGLFMNGFGYATNRFSYALSLYFSLLTALGLEFWGKTTRKQVITVAILVCLYGIMQGVVNLVLNRIGIRSSRPLKVCFEVAFFIATATVALVLMQKGIGKQFTKILVAGFTCVSLVVCLLLPYATGDKWIEEFHAVEDGFYAETDVTTLVVHEDNEEPSRTAVSYVSPNTNLLCGYAPELGYFGTGWYSSLTPASMFRKNSMTGSNTMSKSFRVDGNGLDTEMELLGAVSDIVCIDSEGMILPYACEPYNTVTHNGKQYTLARYADALPFGYTYDNCMSESEWESLSVPMRRDALLRTAVVADSVLEKEIDNSAYTPAIYRTEAEIEGESFVDGLKVSFMMPEDGEAWILLDGLDVKAEGYIDVSNGEYKNTAHLKTSTSFDGFEQTSVVIPLGGASAGAHSWTIQSEGTARAKYKSLEVWYRSNTDYTAAVNALRESVITDAAFGVNSFSAKISIGTTKWLQLAIPYSSGWSAYVDGEKAELFPSGIMYMGMRLDQGDHTIDLHYETPYMRIGAYISIGALILLIVLSLIDTGKKKEKRRIKQ